MGPSVTTTERPCLGGSCYTFQGLPTPYYHCASVWHLSCGLLVFMLFTDHSSALLRKSLGVKLSCWVFFDKILRRGRI